jgi:DNA-binding transcriptional LysR family regulator
MVKSRRVLNLRSFQVFEAVARHRSIAQAAMELGVTRSAISHQLRNLAERTGEDLIERKGQAILLTEAGARLARSLRSAFDLIEQQVTSLEGNREIIRVGVYSSFATGWLIPRILPFLAAYPHLDVRLIMLYDPHETSSRIADIFITSEPVETGYAAKRLFGEQLVPVCSPSGPSDFTAPMRLISAEAEDGVAGRAWEAFALLNALDTSSIKSGEWLCCSHYILALEMVQSGLGAALLPDFMVERLLVEGALRRLPGVPLPTGQSYEIHVPIERRQDPAINSFSTWLQQTAAEEVPVN